ncbi:MAG TPA: phosphate/phosphite/phosphonate ABC transporter substrate-binding protein [Leucothrix mucor]|uniref:Phosphate/phosphite/phosphonate ABC transporter substrate-binding protein n=1 Tax=Leucothrix mucor TaxID=45248 RepID=A0A7V2WV51_LEUMU|nr:phosphate/phosphite/phosphonate ABC transporter substrate-binding protein [Leucothrix mucor]
MPYVLTVSPDFTPKHIAGWYIFNTWLQKQIDLAFHVELYNSFNKQREAIISNKIDLIYANPYDAAMLVREKGFKALVAPLAKADEAIIACNAESKINTIEDLQPDLNIVTTDDPDVHLMGMMMLEPADLDKDNTNIEEVDGYVLVAKKLLQQNADIGFFLKDAYYDLSRLIRDDLKVLISSEIFVIRHILLAGPELQQYHQQLQSLLLNMKDDAKGASVLGAMGLNGWEKQTQEDTEFMIDLMDTL